MTRYEGYVLSVEVLAYVPTTRSGVDARTVEGQVFAYITGCEKLARHVEALAFAHTQESNPIVKSVAVLVSVRTVSTATDSRNAKAVVFAHMEKIVKGVRIATDLRFASTRSKSNIVVSAISSYVALTCVH